MRSLPGLRNRGNRGRNCPPGGDGRVGLKVKNIRYYKSQPWGFDSNLLMGFFCDLAEEGEIRLEEEELSLAEWVDYRDVPDDPEGLSLTREMMTYFRKQREQGLNP